MILICGASTAACSSEASSVAMPIFWRVSSLRNDKHLRSNRMNSIESPLVYPYTPNGAKVVKSIAFWGVIAFLQHAPKKLSTSKMDGVPQNFREIAQIVGGQNVGNMHVKRSDLKKARTLFFPDHNPPHLDHSLIFPPPPETSTIV